MTDLPPLDQPVAWVVVGPNDQRGPYPLELLIGEVLAGRLHESTPVWWSGLPDWSTMNQQPGVAAELHRRRSGYAPPQPYLPPQPDPATTAQYSQYGQAATTETAPEPAAPEPAAPEPPAPEPAVAEPAVAESAVAEPAPAPEAGPSENWPSETGPEEASNGNGHAVAFVGLVERSTAVAIRVERVDGVGYAIGDAVISAAEAQGFRCTARTTGVDDERFSFDGDEGEQLSVSIGSVAGHDRTAFRSAVPLTLSVRAEHHSVESQEVSDEHGSVVVTTDGWGGAANSEVSLYLPLADYFTADSELDRGAVERDVGSAIAVVRSRLR